MFFFGLLMFVCLVPTVWIYFFQIYPLKWKEKKLIFGVKNRDEFREGETANEVEQIVKKRRTTEEQALPAGKALGGGETGSLRRHPERVAPLERDVPGHVGVAGPEGTGVLQKKRFKLCHLHNAVKYNRTKDVMQLAETGFSH